MEKIRTGTNREREVIKEATRLAQRRSFPSFCAVYFRLAGAQLLRKEFLRLCCVRHIFLCVGYDSGFIWVDFSKGRHNANADSAVTESLNAQHVDTIRERPKQHIPVIRSRRENVQLLGQPALADPAAIFDHDNAGRSFPSHPP